MRGARIALLILVDSAVIFGVGAIAIYLWAIQVRHQQVSTYLSLLPLLALFPLGFAKAGLYPGFGLGAVETVRRLSLRTSFIFLILAAASFVAKTPALYSRMTFLLAWLGCLVFLPVGRLSFLSLARRAKWWGEPVAIVGTGETARRIILSLRQALSLGYRPRWVLSAGEDHPETLEGLPVLALERAAELAELGASSILVIPEGGRKGATQLVHELQESFRHVILISTGDSVPIEGVVVRNLGGVLGVEFQNQLLKRRHQVLKRVMDMAVAFVGLIVAAPFVLLAGLAIKFVDWGPSLFSQEREGLDGRRIRVFKLRTMYADAGGRLDDYLATNAAARSEWESHFKLVKDPRVLPVVGTFLRRFSLDELPQLWSVLKGEMSLVGPRPFPYYHLERLSTEARALRRSVRPGITGLWQVMVRSSGTVAEQEMFDTHYIRNWSVWMDLYIMGRTVLAVLATRGAY